MKTCGGSLGGICGASQVGIISGVVHLAESQIGVHIGPPPQPGIANFDGWRQQSPLNQLLDRPDFEIESLRERSQLQIVRPHFSCPRLRRHPDNHKQGSNASARKQNWPRAIARSAHPFGLIVSSYRIWQRELSAESNEVREPKCWGHYGTNSRRQSHKQFVKTGLPDTSSVLRKIPDLDRDRQLLHLRNTATPLGQCKFPARHCGPRPARMGDWLPGQNCV